MAEAKARGVNEDTLGWIRWKQESNRNMRASTMASQSALRRAEDISDKAAFDRLETGPKAAVYKKFAPQVEKHLEEMRRNGQPSVPRLVILKLLLGDSFMNGTVKPKAEKKETDAPSVPRGRTPTVRSDVSSKQRMTERDQRRARLENQPI